MTYIPTTAELDEMGFRDNELYVDRKDIDLYDGADIAFFKDSGWELILGYGSEYAKFYPQSRQDIETLIRLFTKP